MAAKEARARIKINQRLSEAGWRFFEDENGPATIQLEPNVKLTTAKVDALGENFETQKNGFVDFLLLDRKGFPFVVLEAKAEDKNPLIGKEQARRYAKSQNCRFVILSNGNLHYLWDLTKGNPHQISAFPSPDELAQYRVFQPNPEALARSLVGADYIALTQLPGYAEEAGWKNETEREAFVRKNKLRFLREYQLRAIHSLQRAVKNGQDRFLFEMATGTGKTLTSAAVLKLFLRTGNARRALFLVDRLELEDQAQKAFVQLLKNDFKSVIYKERRGDWHSAEIVVTTVQSLLTGEKYKKNFAPTDFDLVISDEAHRSIGGNARAVFEYFHGYKLGLTATPKDYLKKFNVSIHAADPRELERRSLLDTYKTFGCESGEPTFRYSLLDGVRDGFLINPVVADVRTDITTKLLSEQGYAVVVAVQQAADGTDSVPVEETFFQRDFERKFFSEPTNRMFCETFLQNALRDPISGEIGKSLLFAVSQSHAAKLTQLLNEIADQMFPGKYQSDFAVQVTSQIPDAQQFTINFTNNNLLGSGNFNPNYKTSKARICVTVGMMTTGYDCPDLLNVVLMRPIFSPSDFVQIKGRGTRKHRFTDELHDARLKAQIPLSVAEKAKFKLFDFFANCEYFDAKFNYDEKIELPREPLGGIELPPGSPQPPTPPLYENVAPDPLKKIVETVIGAEGMRIDRMLFQKFEENIRENPDVKALVESEEWDKAEAFVAENLLASPAEADAAEKLTLDKLRSASGMDRRLNLREILEKIFGRIARFKTKDELMENEFARFLTRYPSAGPPERAAAIRRYFKAYLTDSLLRAIIDGKRFTDLNWYPGFTTSDYRAVPVEWRTTVPEYIKDNVPLNAYL